MGKLPGVARHVYTESWVFIRRLARIRNAFNKPAVSAFLLSEVTQFDKRRRTFREVRNESDGVSVDSGATSRAVSLLAILTTSMFLLSGAVRFRGYFWPIYSLALLAIVEVVLLLPVGLNRQLWFYLLAFLLWLTAGWFFVGSLLFWLATARQLA